MDAGGGVFPDHEGIVVAAGAAVAHPGADNRRVIQLEIGVGLQRGGSGQAAGFPVELGTEIAFVGGLDGKQELVFAAVALVGVKGVVVVESADQVAGIDGAAPELEAVVGGGVSLDKLDGGAAADGAEGQGVDFLVGLDGGAAMPDGDITQDAGAVVVVAASEAMDPLSADLDIGQAFIDLVFGIGDIAGGVDGRVDAGVAEEDDAAPESALVEVDVGGIEDIVIFGGEDDGVVGGAFGVDFCVLADDQAAFLDGGGAEVFALDDGARLDEEGGAAQQVAEPVEDIGVGPGPIIRPGRQRIGHLNHTSSEVR